MLTASQIGTAARRFQAAYAAVMAPLSRELDMAPSALDILLYLANKPGDRRKCRLLCTEKAWPVIRRGRQYQADFTARMTEGLSPGDLAVCQRCLAALDANLTALSQGLPEKENDR